MITHIQDYLNKQIPCSDLCIIGTGAAGLELAKQLQKCFSSITILEGGEEQFDWQQQKLCRFQQQGRSIRTPDYSQPFDIQTAQEQQSRLRQYGGTLNIWGGKWKALDSIDFLPKPYIGESGWPFSYTELYSHYISVASDYNILDLLWLKTNPAQIPTTITRMEGFSPRAF